MKIPVFSFQFLSSAYVVSPGPTSRNSFYHSFILSFFHSVSNFLDCTVYSLWWEPWPRENCTVCTVHVYTLLTRTVPTTHLEIKLAWVLALQSWAYNNQGKYRIIGTSIDFVNLRLIMNWHELRLAMKYFKQKYWHEFRHCSRRHSTKINWNKVIKKKKYK